MSGGNACRCAKPDRTRWVVYVYRANYSAFNGYKRTPSDYSAVECQRERGGCGAIWRTKAAYVETLRIEER